MFVTFTNIIQKLLPNWIYRNNSTYTLYLAYLGSIIKISNLLLHLGISKPKKELMITQKQIFCIPYSLNVLFKNLISITIWRWNSRSHHVFFVDWFNLVNIKWFDALIKNFVHLIQDFENLNDKWRKNNICINKNT